MQAPTNGFERVYRRELPFVWAAARRMGVHPAALDDAVQDVFLTAYRRWGDLHYEVSPRAWLYGVTRRVAFRYRRSEARTLRRKAAVAQAGTVRSSTPQAERDGARDVDAVLASLEPTQREVFVMAELLDMSGPEIAAELEIPLNTVYSRLRLARRQLERKVLRGEVGPWAAAVRRREQPPPGHVQRSWIALLPMLRSGPAVGVLGGMSVSKLLGGLAAVGLVGAVAILGSPGRELGVEEVTTVSTARVVPSSEASGRAAASGGAPVEAPSERIEDTTPSTVQTMEAEPPETAAPPPVVRGSAARAPSPSRAPSSTEAPTPSVEAPASSLEAEVAALDRATAALRSNDAVQALRWLAEHEQRFPGGRLVDVRKATRVRALCRLGRNAEARAEAAALRREHPDSAVARRVPDSCGEA